MPVLVKVRPKLMISRFSVENLLKIRKKKVFSHFLETDEKLQKSLLPALSHATNVIRTSGVPAYELENMSINKTFFFFFCRTSCKNSSLSSPINQDVHIPPVFSADLGVHAYKTNYVI